jgi:mannosyltransferase OCH1-like enzyme
MNIPRQLLHIWIGPNPPPMKWMGTWPEKHPLWDYKVFSENDLKNRTFYNQHLIDEYYKRNKFNGVADLIRYELLYEYGGFIPPADAVCLENTEELFVEDEDTCYTVYENEIIRPGYVSPIYAACPQNKFIKLIIETLHALEPAQLKDRVWESTGNLFLKNMIELHNPKIKIFPSHFFIPKHFKAKTPRYIGPDKIYADQMWGTTRKTYDNGI